MTLSAAEADEMKNKCEWYMMQELQNKSSELSMNSSSNKLVQQVNYNKYSDENYRTGKSQEHNFET